MVFVLRISPEIIEEENSGDEFGSEDQDDDDVGYSFPCEGSKVIELVSKVASLSLGTVSTVARTPARVRAHVPLSVAPRRIPASSPVAAVRPVAANPLATHHTMPMEIDEDVLHPKAMIHGAHPQGISEAVSMKDVVFHPEANDMKMTDTLATNRKLLQVALIYLFFPVELVTAGAASSTSHMRGPTNVRPAFCPPTTCLWNYMEPEI